MKLSLFGGTGVVFSNFKVLHGIPLVFGYKWAAVSMLKHQNSGKLLFEIGRSDISGYVDGNMREEQSPLEMCETEKR